MSTTYAVIATKRLTISQPGGDREVPKGCVVDLIVWDGEGDFEWGLNTRLEAVQEGWGVVDGKLVELPQEVPGAPDAPSAPIRVIRALAFRDRFSQEQQDAISVAAMQAAAAGNGRLLSFTFNQAAASETNLDDPRVQEGVAALAQAELITAAQAAALLADGRPDEAV